MPPMGIGAGSMKTAVVFCFFNIFSWVSGEKVELRSVPNLSITGLQALCAFLAYKRFLIGAGDEFTSAFETDPANVVHQQAYSYSMDNDNEQYSASPFGQPQQGGKCDKASFPPHADI